MEKEKVVAMKIVSLEMENVKRVSLVRLAPTQSGLTVIGGDNAQGKSSIIDGIIYALGGEKYRPENLQREDGMAPARIRIELSGGLIVERRGKNASLHVTDATGQRHGQKLLDDFVEELALNLPKFMLMKDDDKAEVLLRTLGIADQLEALTLKEKQAFDRRHDFGVLCDQKKKYAAELKEYPDVPEQPLSAAELIAQSQNILMANATRQKLRADYDKIRNSLHAVQDKIKNLHEQLAVAEKKEKELSEDLDMCEYPPVAEDQTTEEIERQIAEIDEINAKVRANLDKAAALAEAEEYERKMSELTLALEKVRQERRDLLNGAAMPLPELSIGQNAKGHPVLLYRDQPWGSMSTMEQYRVATAVVRKLKPGCGFILLDGLEVFDKTQLEKFNAWLTAENLQAICTRVGKDEASSIVIEDGYAVQDGTEPSAPIDLNAPIMVDKNINEDEVEEW